MSKSKPTPCPGCGAMKYAATLCRDCRVARATKPCAWCGASFTSKRYGSRGYRRFCSSVCSGKACSAERRAKRGAVTAHARRVDREANAAGLGRNARRRLLARWRKQGRACWYCPRPAATVDHLIPLVRGGTNHEGNLVPACLSCNSRKQDRLPIEFRLGKQASSTYQPFRERPKPQAKAKPPKPRGSCLICSAEYVMTTKARRTCGSRGCQDEYVRRLAREKYRERVRLPPTWSVPVKRRAA